MIYHCRNMMDCHAAVLYPLPKTTHPFRRERTALKKANLCLPTKVRFFRGGKTGIRTLGALLTHTRFPVVRLRPAQPSFRIRMRPPESGGVLLCKV